MLARAIRVSSHLASELEPVPRQVETVGVAELAQPRHVRAGSAAAIEQHRRGAAGHGARHFRSDEPAKPAEPEMRLLGASGQLQQTIHAAVRAGAPWSKRGEIPMLPYRPDAFARADRGHAGRPRRNRPDDRLHVSRGLQARSSWPHQHRRWSLEYLGRVLGGARAHDRADLASSTPTSSIRTATRWRSPRPTSAPALLGLPVWLLTHNPYATHNVALLAAFVMAFRRRLLLVPLPDGQPPRRGGERRILFAFCPFIFARTAHIQLLFIGTLPFCLLRFTGLPIGRPSHARSCSARLLWATALTCAYYGIFAAMMVGLGTLLFAYTRGSGARAITGSGSAWRRSPASG